jgi:type I restriction enzyme S subunit
VSELPQGWARTELGAIAELIMGQSPPSNTYNSEGKGLPFYQGKAEFGHLFPEPAKHCSRPIKVAEEGDILVSVRAPVGPSNLCREKSCIGRGLAAIRPLGEIPSLYLFYFLRSIENWLSRQGTGSTFTAISKTDLQQLSVLLAPLPEQRRIVAKLEKLLGRVDACQKRLEKIPLLLKRFRQSVLAAACSGRLTEDWRAGQPDTRHAPAVIERLSNDATGKDIESALHEIPDSWILTCLDRICTKITDGEHLTPPLSHEGVPLLSAKDVRDDFLDFSATKFVSDEVARKSRARCNPEKGDILVVSRGATVGRACLVQTDETFCLMGSVLLFKPDRSLVMPRLIEFCLKNPYSLAALISRSSSTAQQAIYIKDMRGFPVAIPPHSEQQEIVRRVEAFFAFADQIEVRYTKAKAHVDKLTQSVLAKAFRGELVPQDPNDEPAEELLRRIREQRLTADASATTRKRRVNAGKRTGQTEPERRRAKTR